MATGRHPQNNPQPGPQSPHGDRNRVPVQAVGLNPDELKVLETLRLFCIAYADPASMAWEQAFETCTREFGPTCGPRIGMATMKVMSALRISRRTTYSFTNPACSCCRHTLSDHELQMMSLLKAQRRGDGLARQTHAVILCEGQRPERFLASMESLADCLNDLAKSTHPKQTSLQKKRIRFSQ
ncbi:hypothetical protein [Roseibium sp.]|uniref:hypothetical protein n=1 Tax=Roseibium sp. TaxID=1936156 RepID=UPI003A97331A